MVVEEKGFVVVEEKGFVVVEVWQGRTWRALCRRIGGRGWSWCGQPEKWSLKCSCKCGDEEIYLDKADNGTEFLFDVPDFPHSAIGSCRSRISGII